VILFSFISPRSSRRNYPADVASDRADENNFNIVEKSEHHVADLALAIRPTDEGRTAKNKSRVVEIDVTGLQIAVTFRWIPIECAGLREEFCDIVLDHARPSGKIRSNLSSCIFPCQVARSATSYVYTIVYEICQIRFLLGDLDCE
jgi:hypothetical protein